MERQTDTILLYDFRVRKIKTTFRHMDNAIHFAIQSKRNKGFFNRWITAGWADDEEGALRFLHRLIDTKYPSWMEKCVFKQPHGTSKWKYIKNKQSV